MAHADFKRALAKSIDLAELFAELSPGNQPKRLLDGTYVASCTVNPYKGPPSVVINPQRGTFYCSHCGDEGDAVRLYQRSFDITEAEAIEDLAQRARLETESPETMKRKSTFAALEDASWFFQGEIEG